jgi:hypothetical protein
VNLPLVFVLSLYADADLLFPALLEHRGISHSVLVLLLALTPGVVLFGRRAITYFASAATHSLIGDFLVGHNRMLWSINKEQYGVGIATTSAANAVLEWVVSLLALLALLRTRDLRNLQTPRNSNLVLMAPSIAILALSLPSLWGIVTLESLIPSLLYLSVFSVAILNSTIPKMKRRNA